MNEEPRTFDDLSDNAKRALEDLMLFGNYYWGLQLEEQPHRWMCDELMKTLGDNETPYLIFDVPRGCYKTSIVTCGAVLQYLRQLYYYDNPYHRIVYASNTLELGEGFLTLIENILRAGGNERRIDEDFGRLWKDPTKLNRKSSRRKNGIVLKPRIDRGEIAAVRDPNFFIASIKRRTTGMHADGAILDDLNDPDNVNTPEQLKKTQKFYRQVYPIIHTKDRVGNLSHIWMTCTPWHDDDVRGMIIREEQEKKLEDAEYHSPWRVVKATSHNEDGTLFFPTKLSEKELARLKDVMKGEYFAAYEGSPLAPGDGLAEKDQIRWRPRETFPALRWPRICVDPNQHSEARALGCYAAIVAGGYDNFGKLWIWDARGSRDWDAGKLIEELYRLQDEHPDWPIFIEDEHMRHFDHAVNLEFVNRMHRAEKDGTTTPRHLRLNYVPAPRNLSKYERWQGAIKPRLQSASIFFAQEIPASIKAEIETELLRGRISRFKDFLDALAMMETGITPRYRANNGGAEIVPIRKGAGTEPNRTPTWSDVVGKGVFG